MKLMVLYGMVAIIAQFTSYVVARKLGMHIVGSDNNLMEILCRKVDRKSGVFQRPPICSADNHMTAAGFAWQIPSIF